MQTGNSDTLNAINTNQQYVQLSVTGGVSSSTSVTTNVQQQFYKTLTTSHT